VCRKFYLIKDITYNIDEFSSNRDVYQIDIRKIETTHACQFLKEEFVCDIVINHTTWNNLEAGVHIINGMILSRIEATVQSTDRFWHLR